MDRFLIRKIPRVEESVDVQEEKEMQVSDSDLDEEIGRASCRERV